MIISLSFWAGCSGSLSSYAYRALTDDCDCEEYIITDKPYDVEYRFRAGYKMEKGVVTTIRIEFRNGSKDTLFLDPGVVKISSRNISYQYNNKFLPLPHLVIPPSGSDNVVLTGSDITQEDAWNKIAGERLTITIKSMRLGNKTLSQRAVVFVPVNPKLENTP